MKNIVIYLLTLLLVACNHGQKMVFTTYQSQKTYTPLVTQLPAMPLGQTPKNIILMIGDGMGLTHMSVAWTVNHGALNLLACPYVGLSRTTCTNRLITDSGAGGTALAIGQKTNKNFIGCDSLGAIQPSLFDLAHQAGYHTAMSVVCRLCDATPADFCCHSVHRDNYDEINACYPTCELDFIAGGGAYFLTHRQDGRNIINEMKQQGYHVYREADSLFAATEFPVFACLADSEYVPAPMRGDLFQRQTIKAIHMMGDQPFFMMVEASCIDDWCHANNLERVVEETLDFDRTIGQVLQWAAQDGQTLVVITADHESGALTLVDGDWHEGQVVCHFAEEGHSNIHVPIYAFGPASECFTGTMENAELSHRIQQLIQPTK